MIMQGIFYPQKVAVIGVSSKPTNLGKNIIGNLVEFGFDGVVYAVGYSGGIINTKPIYKSVGDIQDEIDLAIIITPAHTVSKILEECGKKGIKFAIIETAGFREYGKKGLSYENEMTEVANKYGIQFVGPNCIGAINMENGFCVPFPRLKKFLKQGDVSMISQSGGVGMSVLNLLANEGVGLNKFVSIGNMLNINAEDALEYLIEDEGTRIIFIYLESMRDGRRLMELCQNSQKPILIFKSNIGVLGQKIAMSHTASLTSDDKVVDAAFQQAGIIRVHDATELGNNLKILELPPMKGKNLAVISRSGGHAVLAADACELSGFNLASFPEKFLRDIEKHFRASVIKLTNPLDLGDLFDLDVYGQIIEKTLQLKNVDGVIFLHTSISAEENKVTRELLVRIMEMVKKYDKPVAFYNSTSAEEIIYLKQNYSFPIFTKVVETIRALGMNYKYFCQLSSNYYSDEVVKFAVNKNEVSKILKRVKSENRNLLLSESLSVLQNYGINSVEGKVAFSVNEAIEYSEKIGYPVAIKVVAEQISHKSDFGGVQLNLSNHLEVEEAYKELMERISEAYPNAKIDGVLVQPMVVGGRELILGGRQDSQFGPVVLLGLGGIFVEIFKEIQVRVAPIKAGEAKDMVEKLKGSHILKGARGHKASDIDAIEEYLMRLSQLLNDFPEISEIDINPLKVFYQSEGCKALDARIILNYNI